MHSLSLLTIVWSMTASAALLLGLMHLARWAMNDRPPVDLTFSILAFCFVGVAFTEAESMFARTPEEWGFWVRWCHLPLFGLIAATVLFVRQYLGTGRVWLAASVIGLRAIILVVNFAHAPNFNFNRVDSLRQIPFLGETVSVVGQADTAPWQVLGTFASILLAVFVLDAAISSWRRGSAEDRRRAAIIGGAIFLFVGLAAMHVQLVIWRVVTLPLLITPSFTIALLAMAYELSRDMLRASRLARQLQESQLRLELAAGAANLGLWEWDSWTNRVWATRQASDIFGLADSKSTQITNWLARIHPEDVKWILPAMESAVAEGGEHTAEFRVCPLAGGTRWVFARGRAESSDAGPGKLMRGVIRDVSDQRRAQDESQELRRELTHAGRVTLLGQLASALAHELSQPLGAILRNTEAAELLLGGPDLDREELKAIVADIQRDDRRAGDVIDRLRSLLKRRQMSIQPIVPDALLHEVMSLVRMDAASRRVVIDCTLEPDLPLVAGDRVHLSQVLLNIIINAMDAVMDVEAGDRRVSVRAQRAAGNAVEITVTDSGTGIPADSFARIFEPFYTTKTAGMGMGLSVSRTIVEAHGGQLTAANTPEGGAKFSLTLPIAPRAPV